MKRAVLCRLPLPDVPAMPGEGGACPFVGGTSASRVVGLQGR